MDFSDAGNLKSVRGRLLKASMPISVIWSGRITVEISDWLRAPSTGLLCKWIQKAFAGITFPSGCAPLRSTDLRLPQ